MSRRNSLIAILLAVAASGLAGCPSGPEFTRPNYDTVYFGQEQHEVQSKMGRPQTQTPDCWQYISTDPYYIAARIYFRDGIVTRKEWFASAADLAASRPAVKATSKPASAPTTKPLHHIHVK